jgi:hypothetical protein
MWVASLAPIFPDCVAVPGALGHCGRVLSTIRHATATFILLLLSARAATDPYSANRYESGINPLRIPSEPVPLSGTFACTANGEAGLPAIAWRRIPFRREGDKLTGLYAFRDSFDHQDSVIFAGSLIGGRPRWGDRRAQGWVANFTADLTGTPASMTGPMMSGTSHHPFRSCSLALMAAR